MKSNLLILTIALTLFTRLTMAVDISYPTTEKDIVAALTLKDGKVEVGGVEYRSESGKVYKIIDGTRFRVRGIKVMMDTDLAPKAAALIHFDFNSAMILSDSFGLLDNYANALKDELSAAKLEIDGHTDSIGDIETNLKLSRERAESVRQYLLHQGIASDRLTVAPFGATKPAASNDTDAGRAKNRRVEFVRIE